MKITLIAAMANNRAIGVNNTLPWRLPADLQRFKKLTMGKAIIMGRNTYHSIGRALPGRLNIVVSHTKDLKIDGCEVADSIDAALDFAKNTEKQNEIFVIGGASLYQQMINKSDKLILTLINLNVTGDAFFPILDPSRWQETSRENHQANVDNPYDYSFVDFEKITC